jgi:hypothetical protein
LFVNIFVLRKRNQKTRKINREMFGCTLSSHSYPTLGYVD